MQHSFSDFLQHGGDSQYRIAQRHGRLVGYRLGLSLKSTFPDYSTLRAGFSERLDQVIAENTLMLLNALTPPDSVPTVSASDLRDVSDAKTEALNAWDARLESIFNEYQNHPQRLRPLRASMEERLLRAFAGLINQLRQEELGIEGYIWRSQEDAKVRDSHAEYHDQIFRWEDPPAGGHPGEAHNCRCFAEPIAPTPQSNVVLADFDGSGPPQDLSVHEAGGGHTIGLHVGKSEAFLIGSVSTPRGKTLFVSQYRWRHGTFPSLEAAEKLTNSNLARNLDVVNEVASGRLRRAFITSDFGSITGFEAY
ncbi:phage minor head protein [Thalassobius sp. Cn5-15]|uniref:phage minor head protein n=1 Tax=Thalassobius sp. Cn5-15 TaxID=2917763 RepID=UPI001EF2E5E7|nr:phage minor head protein [Thalassobius sp. Cn5-15]MCG7491962.1 minor capsid protein [Thalassobius sp. Cn5-15]